MPKLRLRTAQSVRGAGKEGQQPPGSEGNEGGAVCAPGARGELGGHPAREGAQLWYPLGREPSAPTRKDVVTQRELP